jgi:hypothetical protein
MLMDSRPQALAAGRGFKDDFVHIARFIHEAAGTEMMGGDEAVGLA